MRTMLVALSILGAPPLAAQSTDGTPSILPFLGLVAIVVALMYSKSLKERFTQNAAMICPHCQTKGSVATRKMVRKKGVSGGKATAALLTGGASLLVVGLSRKEPTMEAQCANCTAEWTL